MANVYGQISTTFTDALGVPSSHVETWQMDDSKTLANLVTAANDWFDHISPLSDAGADTIRCSLIITANNPTTAETGSEVERTGLFNYTQAGIRYKEGFDIPSIKQSLIVDGKIDLTATEVTNWETWILSAHNTFQILTRFIHALSALVDALITFRKKRKLESRRSFEVNT